MCSLRTGTLTALIRTKEYIGETHICYGAILILAEGKKRENVYAIPPKIILS
jgi:hypothetical protein